MSSGGAGLIRCNQTIRAVIGAAESKHAASTPHGLLGAAESCGEGAAIMVGGGVLTGVWPLVCQGRSGCEGGMGCSSHVAKTLTRRARTVIVIALVAWARVCGVCRSPRHAKLGLMLEGSVLPCLEPECRVAFALKSRWRGMPRTMQRSIHS
jgi:hypothetical protein